ncbi:hypothetical protein N0V93_001629 [Gnomoniopsis smithogilvyi]|uniref:Uncharacterized protein n=1 Tax=Gnomoniopsis smithogilvyi TaxID=1191159 RepID=A0A9W8Z1Z7_9PEZI|nr:hypothetical protein N0V93_001629 [Gnomoniopsis smithogilvyi]
MDDALHDRLTRGLPYIYKSPQNWQREWESSLRQELGSYLDQIEQSIRGFAAFRPVLLEFMSKYERDGMAERILYEYVEERLRGVPLHLLSEDFASPSGERRWASTAIDEAGPEFGDELDRMDRRSVTMAAEPTPTPNNQLATTSMAPPPRPIAPLAPMTPVTPFLSWRNVHIQAEAGPSNRQGVLDSPVLNEASDKVGIQKGKRSIDSLQPQEQQQSLSSSPKRLKMSSASVAPQVPINISRAVDWFEVDTMEYMFSDSRCGPGWLVIRCYTGKTQFLKPTVSFRQHPLKNNLALDHFNQRLPCHPAPPKDKYTEEMVLQKFAYRVYIDALSNDKIDPTDQEVSDSNAELRQKAEQKDLPDICFCDENIKGKGKKKAAKGKTRVGDVRVDKAGAQDTDDSYREEVWKSVP